MKKEKQFIRNVKGITLIALVITIIVMLILAGVSLNATIGENGILTRAKDAKEAQELAKTKEDLEYMFLDYNVWQSEKKTISEFLKNKMESGEIEEFRAYPVNNEFKMVIKKEGKYFFVEQEDGVYKAVQMGGLSDENSDFTIVTREEFKNVVDGSMKFELANDKKTTLIFYDEIEDALNFDIVSGNVTIYMTQDMTLTNRGLKRSAVDVHSGATLNLYVLENVKLTVDSGYGEDANGNVPGKGGYAGIHVPEGATLNLYGKGTIEAFGGKAGNGANAYGNASPTAGGGGAGAGIGGNGGNGSDGIDGDDGINYKVAENGGTGESCGNINIYNGITVFAYGGAGGKGGTGGAYNKAGAGGAGGYPAAGIGGGGAGGAGSTCCSGAGGYTGGSGSGTKLIAENGLAGYGYGRGYSDGIPKNKDVHHYSGGGYYASGTWYLYTDKTNIGDSNTNVLGGCSLMYHQSFGHEPGWGGTAGKGGTIKVSEVAKVYAFNGNLYTDGTSYDSGINQALIYLQDGKNIAKYKITVPRSDGNFTAEKVSALTTVEKSGYVNTLYNIDNKYILKKIENINIMLGLTGNPLSNVDMSTQGIGSGAGYIEVSNGTYTIDSNLN